MILINSFPESADIIAFIRDISRHSIWLKTRYTSHALSIFLFLPLLLLPLTGQGQDPDPPAMNLHFAALSGEQDMVYQHIRAGTDLNQKDIYGSTPLNIAVTFGRPGIVRSLLEGGADPDIVNNEGSTPLHIASFLGYADIAAALVDQGANLHLRNSGGSTALDIALTDIQNDEVIFVQLEKGLAPFRYSIDRERVKTARPAIAQLIRPKTNKVKSIDYLPVNRPDWPVSTPEAEGLNTALVDELFWNAQHEETIYSLIIVKNGKLIAEGYFNDGAIDRPTGLASVTKSVTSALTGIAHDRGILSHIDTDILHYFPEIAKSVIDDRKRHITIEHLLQMRGGYPWEETDSTLWAGLLAGDYPPLIEQFPLVNAPGAGFNYSNLSSNWLGIIIAQSAGVSLENFAEKTLFKPMRFLPGKWTTDLHGNNNGCGDLYLTSRDLAKFGLLYLNKGIYQGEQLIPESWVEASLKSYSDDAWVLEPDQHHVGRYFRDLGYGYQWWSATVGSRRFNFAWGHGGQLIVLLDDLDMVIVTNANPFHLQHNPTAWRHEQAQINLVGQFIVLLDRAGR